MSGELDVETFLSLVPQSGLITADELEQDLQDFSARGLQWDSPRALAAALVDRGRLTAWQAERLLQGRHRGFFLGPYKLLDLLGKGGMSNVYRAEHRMMRRRCAVKVLPSRAVGLNSSMLERFCREAQAVAALDHPNIVRAYDFNRQVQGQLEVYYLAMEYLDGKTVQELVQEQGPLDFITAADLVRQAAEGLAHAHQHDLVHRDIKPANLMVDGRGVLKLLDLGLARFYDDPADSSITTAHGETLLGTADYVSPEQALNGHEVDARADVYSLGCTLFFLLSGHAPFHEGSVATRLVSHQVKPLPPIVEERPDTPADLVAILSKMTAKEPADRYQTAAELAAAITAWLSQHARSPANLPQPNGRAGQEPRSETHSTQRETSARPQRPEATGRGGAPRTLAWMATGILLAAAVLVAAMSGPRRQNAASPASHKINGPTAWTPADEPSSQVEERRFPPHQTRDEPTAVQQAYQRWRAHSDQLRQDPDLLLYFTFEQPAAASDIDVLVSQAEQGPLEGLEAMVQGTPRWAPGRWPQKQALRFMTAAAPQHLALSDADSRHFNFDASFSLLIWFRIERFQSLYQPLIAKGDDSFRVSRDRDTSYLMFAINEYQLPDRLTSKPQMTKVIAEQDIEDGQWHLVAAVFSTDEDEGTGMLQLYIDGLLSDSAASPHALAPNDEPLLIGANSRFLPRNEPLPEGRKPEVRFFTGEMDEVAILRRALTAAEIQEMYQVGRPLLED